MNKNIDSDLPIDKPEEKDTKNRNHTKLILPVTGEWNVHSGGYNKNNSEENIRQTYSLNLTITDSTGKSYRSNGKINENYFAFDKPITAPCDGIVIAVVEGISDNIPGIVNTKQFYGNSVVLKTNNEEYISLSHLKLNSIKVKFNDLVKKSQLLGHCGNSGNSPEPQLHFFIQPKTKTEGSKGYKCYFENLIVNGEFISHYSPIKDDRIKNSFIE